MTLPSTSPVSDSPAAAVAAPEGVPSSLSAAALSAAELPAVRLSDGVRVEAGHPVVDALSDPDGHVLALLADGRVLRRTTHCAVPDEQRSFVLDFDDFAPTDAASASPGDVLSLELSADGRYAAVLRRDGVRLYDATGLRWKELGRLQEPKTPAPKAKAAASATLETTPTKTATTTAKKPRPPRSSSPRAAVAFTENNKLLRTAGLDGVIRSYRLPGLEPVAKAPMPDKRRVRAVRLSRDARFAYFAVADG